LPPAATLGMMLGSGKLSFALGAALLLAVNVVCVNLASKVVFLVKGVKPRSWLEKQKAQQSVTMYILVWVAILMVLVAVIYLRRSFILE
jgi:uncharacterized membrane protein